MAVRQPDRCSVDGLQHELGEPFSPILPRNARRSDLGYEVAKREPSLFDAHSRLQHVVLVVAGYIVEGTIDAAGLLSIPILEECPDGADEGANDQKDLRDSLQTIQQGRHALAALALRRLRFDRWC